MKQPICLVSMIILLLLPALAFATALDIVGDLNRLHVVTPGSTQSGTISISNNGESVEEVMIYQTDFRHSHVGKTIFKKNDPAARSNQAWISLNSDRLKIPPKERASLTYKINVPSDSSLTGTYWSIIMIEIVDKSKLIPPGKSKDKAQISLKYTYRYAVNILTAISDTGNFSLSFSDPQLQASDSNTKFQLRIDCLGSRHVDSPIWLDLYNSSGTSLGRFEGGIAYALPDCSITKEFLLPELSKGTYKALVLIDGEEDDVYAADYTLEIN